MLKISSQFPKVAEGSNDRKIKWLEQCGRRVACHQSFFFVLEFIYYKIVLNQKKKKKKVSRKIHDSFDIHTYRRIGGRNGLFPDEVTIEDIYLGGGAGRTLELGGEVRWDLRIQTAEDNRSIAKKLQIGILLRF